MSIFDLFTPRLTNDPFAICLFGRYRCDPISKESVIFSAKTKLLGGGLGSDASTRFSHLLVTLSWVFTASLLAIFLLGCFIAIIRDERGRDVEDDGADDPGDVEKATAAEGFGHKRTGSEDDGKGLLGEAAAMDGAKTLKTRGSTISEMTLEEGEGEEPWEGDNWGYRGSWGGSTPRLVTEDVVEADSGFEVGRDGKGRAMREEVVSLYEGEGYGRGGGRWGLRVDTGTGVRAEELIEMKRYSRFKNV